MEEAIQFTKKMVKCPGIEQICQIPVKCQRSTGEQRKRTQKLLAMFLNITRSQKKYQQIF